MDKSYWEAFFDSSNLPVLWIIITAVVIFLAIREVLCWYFKFNRMVELMEQINYKLDKLGHLEKDTELQEPKQGNNIVERKSNYDVVVDKDTKKHKGNKVVIKDFLTKEYHLSNLFSKEDEKHNLER